MRPSTLAIHRRRLTRVLELLNTRLDSPPTIANLARVMGLSPRQFTRVFARILGETPQSHLRRLRLEHAARELTGSRRSVLAVALDAGYESHESFTRSFTSRFGCSPASYRARPQVSLWPRDRRSFWRAVLAGGLRPHLENSSIP